MLIRNTLLYLPAQVIGPLSQFVAILVFTHWMAPEPYGVFTYILASQDFVFFLCVSWWSQYTVRYFGDHARDDVYRDSEGAILVGTGLVQIAAALFALWLLTTPTTLILAAATIAFMLTRCFNLHLGERARARSRFFDYTIAATVGPAIGFVAAWLAVMVIAPTPAVALFGYAAVQAVSLVWLVGRQRIVLHAKLPDARLLRQALAFGAPLIVAGVAAWFGMNAIRVLVDHSMGTAAMGLIAVGWTLGHRLTSTLAMLITVAAFPLAVERFRGGSRAQAFGEIARNGVMMLGLVLPAAVGLWLIQGPLIALVVAEPFRVMTAAVLPASLVAGAARNLRTHVTDQIFVLVERTAMVGLMTIVEAILVVAGCMVGLMSHGAVGAAVGSAAGYVIAMVVGFTVARIRAGLRIPLMDVVLVTLATLVMAVAVAATSAVLPEGIGAVAPIAVEVTVGAIAYGIALLLLFPPIARAIRARWNGTQPLRSWKKS